MDIDSSKEFNLFESEMLSDSISFLCHSELKGIGLQPKEITISRGDHYEGFCIEYELSNESEGRTAPLFPVIYSKALVPLDITNELMNLPGNSGHLAIKAAIFKNKDWSYEREWRLVFYTGDDQKIDIQGYPIKAIYLGTKINDEHKRQLIELSKKVKFKIFQMRVSANKFKKEKID